jgi:hypothetical protein
LDRYAADYPGDAYWDSQWQAAHACIAACEAQMADAACLLQHSGANGACSSAIVSVVDNVLLARATEDAWVLAQWRRALADGSWVLGSSSVCATGPQADRDLGVHPVGDCAIIVPAALQALPSFGSGPDTDTISSLAAWRGSVSIGLEALSFAQDTDGGAGGSWFLDLFPVSSMVNGSAHTTFEAGTRMMGSSALALALQVFAFPAPESQAFPSGSAWRSEVTLSLLNGQFGQSVGGLVRSLSANDPAYTPAPALGTPAVFDGAVWMEADAWVGDALGGWGWGSLGTYDSVKNTWVTDSSAQDPTLAPLGELLRQSLRKMCAGAMPANGTALTGASLPVAFLPTPNASGQLVPLANATLAFFPVKAPALFVLAAANSISPPQTPIQLLGMRGLLSVLVAELSIVLIAGVSCVVIGVRTIAAVGKEGAEEQKQMERAWQMQTVDRNNKAYYASGAGRRRTVQLGGANAWQFVSPTTQFFSPDQLPDGTDKRPVMMAPFSDGKVPRDRAGTQGKGEFADRRMSGHFSRAGGRPSRGRTSTMPLGMDGALPSVSENVHDSDGEDQTGVKNEKEGMTGSIAHLLFRSARYVVRTPFTLLQFAAESLLGHDADGSGAQDTSDDEDDEE